MRRFIAALIAAVPFAVIVFCLKSTARMSMSVAGWIVFAIGAWICLLNAYASWIRPWLFVRRGGKLEDYKFVSGIPLLGTPLATVGLILLPPSLPLTLATLLLIVVDTGGWQWFVFSTWTDKELWQSARDS